MNWLDFPSLHALRAFAAVAECGNLSKAGKMLNVTHAAISQQVRNLENQLGTQLVIRDGRGVRLTPQGQEIARALRPAFADIATALESVSTAEVARPLNVSLTAMFASGFLMPKLAHFVEAHPEVELSLGTTIEAVALEPGGVDIALRYGVGFWPGLEAEMLLPGQLTDMGARKLIGDRVLKNPAELLDYPMLQERDSTEFDEWLEKVGVPTEAKRKVVHMPGNLLLDGLKRGDGICATIPTFVEPELRSGELVILFEDLNPDIGYYMVTRPGVQRPPLKTFINWLRKLKPPTSLSPLVHRR